MAHFPRVFPLAQIWANRRLTLSRPFNAHLSLSAAGSVCSDPPLCVPRWQVAHRSQDAVSERLAPSNRRDSPLATRTQCPHVHRQGHAAFSSGLLVLCFSADRFELWFHHALVTIRADAVAELGLGMGGDIRFHLLPVISVVTNFFAISANRQQPLQLFHLGERTF